MDEERYPGERRVLRRFLSELAPIVERELGQDAMLNHAIRRGLASNALDELRRARRLFNQLSRDVKRSLSQCLVERAAQSIAPCAPVQPSRRPEMRVLEKLRAPASRFRLVPHEPGEIPT